MKFFKELALLVLGAINPVLVVVTEALFFVVRVRKQNTFRCRIDGQFGCSFGTLIELLSGLAESIIRHAVQFGSSVNLAVDFFFDMKFDESLERILNVFVVVDPLAQIFLKYWGF